MSEFDVIGHLIDVEHQASSLLLDAQAESDKAISAAKVKADGIYKEKYEQLINELESDYSNYSNEITKKHTDDLNQFKEKISKTALSIDDFNKYLESLLFTGTR